MTKDANQPNATPWFGRRRLTAEEERLWLTVSRGIRPLRKVPKASAARLKPPKPGPGTARNHAEGAEVKPPVRAAAGAKAMSRLPGLPAPPAIPRRDRQQLSRGRAAIDARIDLHGMTQGEAHRALLRFLEHCQAKGAKFALVITGKGAPDEPSGARGVLRRQVPLWLALAEFRTYVLGFDVANAVHGGNGALYLRIRKRSIRL